MLRRRSELRKARVDENVLKKIKLGAMSEINMVGRRMKIDSNPVIAFQ